MPWYATSRWPSVSATGPFDVLLLPPRPFRTEKPLTQDAFQVVSVFLQKRCAYPELCNQHNGPGALLLTPRLDAQTSFAKLFADTGTQDDVRQADLVTLLAAGPPPPAHVTAKHVVSTYGLKHSRTRLASRHTLPSSCLAPPNSSDVMSLGTAGPLLA